MAPAISIRGELLDPVNSARSDVPQSICDHHCRDGVSCNGERVASSR